MLSCRLSALLALVAFAVAHSPPARPLVRLAHPSSIELHVLPRTPHRHARRSDVPGILEHSDSLRLSLTAFDTTFHLHLRPNNVLIHPQATITFVENDDQYSRTLPLRRESVRAYMGEVVPTYRSDARLQEDAAGVVGRVSSAGINSDQTHPTDLGWARIVVHDAAKRLFEGAFSVNGVIHHITTREKYLLFRGDEDVDVEEDGDLVIWRESDVQPPSKTPASTCGHDRLSYNTDPKQNPMLRKYKPLPLVGSEYDEFGLPDFGFHSKRQDIGGGDTAGTNFVDTIGQTSDCPKTQTVLFMGVAADCEYVSRYGSPENATTQILTNWNTLSALYRSTFNVSMGIIDLQVRAADCPATADASAPWNIACSDSVTMNDRLSLFSRWRGDRTDDAGLWHLMSGCPTGTEVGIAWLRTLCQQSATGQDGSFVSGTGVSTAGRTESMVIAHEVGHNFGAIHDCTEGCETNSANCCPLSTGTCNGNSQSIMAPSSNGDSDSPQTFSQCTIGNICSLMGSTSGGSSSNTTCLLDADDTKDRQTISLQMCGNGIVESGEDCDPGGNSNSSCCDPATCKFRSGALCDPENSSCCTDTCGFTAANTTCRASKDSSCDTAETCTGTSGNCPEDVFADNGQECGDELACASGQCTSVSKQCQSVGASLGLEDACPQLSDNCQVSCLDPTSSNTCVILQSLLIDGSPCGLGGTCVNGACASGDAANVIKNWFQQNPSIAIPVAVIAGLLALSLLWCILIRVKHCCCGRQVRQPKTFAAAPLVPINNPRQGWNYAPQPSAGYAAVPLGLGQQDPFRNNNEQYNNNNNNNNSYSHQQENSYPMMAQPTSPTHSSRASTAAYPPPPQRYADSGNYGNGGGHERSLSGYGAPGQDSRPSSGPGDRTSIAPLIQDPSRRSNRLTRS